MLGIVTLMIYHWVVPIVVVLTSVTTLARLVCRYKVASAQLTEMAAHANSDGLELSATPSERA
jgi:hypothetical protein